MITEKEFKELFHRLYSPLCNYAIKIVNDRDRAEDIVQEVLVDFWNKNRNSSEIDKPDNYLIRAVKFKSIDVLRKVTRELAEKDSFDNNVREMYYQDEPIDEEKETSTREILQFAIGQLPEKTRLVFIRSKMDGMSYKEIAEELDISVKTVENQMSRAFKLLREKLKDHRFFEIILIFFLLQ